MARIQNKNLPWTQLRLRSGKVVQTDGDGVLSDISDEDAKMLGATPGWRVAGAIGEVRSDGIATVSRRAPVPPKVEEEPPAAKVEPKAPESPEQAASETEESEEAEGPDIDGLRSKAEALRIAEEYGVEGLTEDMKLADMKAKLNAALYPEG
jgi:hypothetical protein